MLLLILCFCPVFAAQKGGVQYVIPIEYSLIDENELANEAENFFQQYLSVEDEKQKQVLLQKMLSNYSILGEIDKENPLYFTRLGIVYDKLGKDRYAKSNFFRSENLEPNYPYAYYSFANYYFDRKEFKKALKEYLRAYNAGYQNHYETLVRIGTIYQKLGDFTSAINYYNMANAVKPTEEISAKILLLEELLQKNSLYNQRSRQGAEK